MKDLYSKEIIDQFFSYSVDLFLITDSDGIIRRLNPEWERTLGYSMSELEGNKILDFIHPGDVKKTINALKKLAQNKRVLNFVNRYRHKNGTYRWIEWRSFKSEDLIFGTARDITEHKKAENDLRESEEKFRALADQSPNMIFINQKGKVIYANKACEELTGYTLEEFYNDKFNFLSLIDEITGNR